MTAAVAGFSSAPWPEFGPPYTDALLDDRLHQLFGPPATIHQGGGIDWSWEQYSEAVAQLEAEGVIRPAGKV